MVDRRRADDAAAAERRGRHHPDLERARAGGDRGRRPGCDLMGPGPLRRGGLGHPEGQPEGGSRPPLHQVLRQCQAAGRVRVPSRLWADEPEGLRVHPGGARQVPADRARQFEADDAVEHRMVGQEQGSGARALQRLAPDLISAGAPGAGVSAGLATKLRSAASARAMARCWRSPMRASTLPRASS